MKAILGIAINTLHRMIRGRSLWLVGFFGVALVGFLQMSQRADLSRETVMLDAGLTLIKLFGFLLVVFSTLPLFPEERDTKTLHALLALPISRGIVVIGLFVGSLLGLLINLALMHLVFVLALPFFHLPLPALFLRSALLMFEEFALLLSIVQFFSVAVSHLTGVFLSFTVYLVGNLTASLHLIFENTDRSWYSPVFAILYYLLPRFSVFDIKDAALSAHAVPIEYDVAALAYAACVCFLFLRLTIWMFHRQEIT